MSIFSHCIILMDALHAKYDFVLHIYFFFFAFFFSKLTNVFYFSLEHNLPDNLFSSPKAAREYMSAFSADTTTLEENGNEAVVSAPVPTNNLMASSLLPATSTLDMASLKSCYFQVPR